MLDGVNITKWGAGSMTGLLWCRPTRERFLLAAVSGIVDTQVESSDPQHPIRPVRPRTDSLAHPVDWGI